MLKKHYASQYDIRLIKSLSREKLERYAIDMLDQYLHQKQLTHLERKNLEWYVDFISKMNVKEE